MSELEQAADALVAQLHQRRLADATGLERLAVRLDSYVRTDALESLDSPDHPEHLKLEQVRLLHLQNVATGSYRRYLRILQPSLDAALARRRPIHALELACGAGELSFALAAAMARQRLPVHVTGSDVVPSYVEAAMERARSTGSPACFRRLNAFDLKASLDDGDVDVAFIAQSAHHFSPGQLAMMIAQVGAAGARHFVAIDGLRSLSMLGLIPLVGSFSLNRSFIRDGFISARRLHTEHEFELLARLAAPSASVRCETVFPLTSVLVVDYGEPDAGLS
jgi:SAM-dependent methyltransferase